MVVCFERFQSIRENVDAKARFERLRHGALEAIGETTCSTKEIKDFHVKHQSLLRPQTIYNYSGISRNNPEVIIALVI